MAKHKCRNCGHEYYDEHTHRLLFCTKEPTRQKSMSEQMAESFKRPVAFSEVQEELKKNPFWEEFLKHKPSPDELVDAEPNWDSAFVKEIMGFMQQDMMHSVLTQVIDTCRLRERNRRYTGIEWMLDLVKEGGMSPKNFALCLPAVMHFNVPYTINITDVDL